MKKISWSGTLLLLAPLVLGASSALAQDDGETSGTQDQIRTHERLMERIEKDPSLDSGQRERMRKNLRECEELGLGSGELASLFPDGSTGYSAEARLRIQAQVMTLAREGRPVDPICDKMDEGRMKGAPEVALERVAEQMGENLRYAHRYLEEAKNNGVSGAEEPYQERHLERGLALNRWRGLNDGEFEHLQEQARDRARDGDCQLTELCAATETATEMRELGIDSERVMGLCGEALRQGYGAQELRQIGWMMGEAHQHGGGESELCNELQLQVRERRQMGEMMKYAMAEGWMGPESMGHGHGGHSPVDDVMGGGGRHGGGGGGSGGGGGMGGDHH